MVAGGESRRWSSSCPPASAPTAAKAVCGMLNGNGGFVLFGVSDDGRIVGQQVSAGTLEDVAREIRRIQPLPLLSPETVHLPDGRAVVLIRVPRARARTRTMGVRTCAWGPRRCRWRRRTTSRRLVERMHPARRWETQPAVGVDLTTWTRPRSSARWKRQSAAIASPTLLTRSSKICSWALGCCVTDNRSTARSCCSAAATGCCRCFRSARCGWRVSAAATSRSSWIRARKPATRSSCSRRRSSFCATTFRSRAAFSPASSSAWTIRSTRPSPCARRSRTRSATATTDPRRLRWHRAVRRPAGDLQHRSAALWPAHRRPAYAAPVAPLEPHDRERLLPARHHREVGPRHHQDQRANAACRPRPPRVPPARRRGGRALLPPRLCPAHARLARADGAPARASGADLGVGSVLLRDARRKALRFDLERAFAPSSWLPADTRTGRESGRRPCE